MTINLPQAEAIARSHLSDDLRVLSYETREFDVGWVFYYQSAEYLDGGNCGDKLVGNAPLFVARANGRLFSVTYHRPLDESMAAYRACGNPNANLIPEVKVHGCHPGAQNVAAITAIRSHSGLGLAQAKTAIESCLTNNPTTIAASSLDAAKQLVVALTAAGFKSEVAYES